MSVPEELQPRVADPYRPEEPGVPDGLSDLPLDVPLQDRRIHAVQPG